MYSWGSGTNGRLGHGTSEASVDATPIQYFISNSITVAQVSCGRAHSLCLTDEGQVYSFGKGAEGRLGHPNTDDQVCIRKS